MVKGVQTGDQETKIVNFVDDDSFLKWHQLLCQAQAHSDTIRESFQLKNILYLALSVIKRFWRSLTCILMCFWSLKIKYHGMNIISVRVEQGNMADRKPCWEPCLCLLRAWDSFFREFNYVFMLKMPSSPLQDAAGLCALIL